MEAVWVLKEALFLDQLFYAAGAMISTKQKQIEESEAISVHTHRNLAGVVEIAAEWRALEVRGQTSGTAFQSCDFHLVWARHFCDAETELRLVTVRVQGRLALVWPLAVRKTKYGRVASWAGEPVSQYGDVVGEAGASREEWIEAGYAEIHDWGDVDFLHLKSVRDDSIIKDWLARRGHVLGEASETPILDHTKYARVADFSAGSWPQAKRNAKRLKKLRSLGEVSFSIVQPGPIASRLLEEAFSFKRHWLEQRGHFGQGLMDERVDRCLMDMAAGRVEGGLVISCLSVDGETAAIEVGFRRNGRHYAYMGAFSPDFARHSPGFVVTELTIHQGIEEGLQQYDPLPPADDYKIGWSNCRVAVRDYGMVLSWRGYAAYIFAALIRPTAKAIYGKLPLKLRQVLRLNRS